MRRPWRRSPITPNLRRYYADALLSAGKNAAARVELQKILKSEPDDGLSYKRLAMIDREEGRFDDARQELEKAKSLSPDDLEIPYQQALLESTVGNDDKAIEILQGLVKQSERPGGQYTVPEANNRALFLERLGSGRTATRRSFPRPWTPSNKFRRWGRCRVPARRC